MVQPSPHPHRSRDIARSAFSLSLAATLTVGMVPTAAFADDSDGIQDPPPATLEQPAADSTAAASPNDEGSPAPDQETQPDGTAPSAPETPADSAAPVTTPGEASAAPGTETAPVAAEPSTPDAVTALALTAFPLASAPVAATTAADVAPRSLAATGLTIKGGTEGTDYTVDAAAKKIVITSSKEMTVSGTSQGYSLEVAAGNHATLVLAGVTIEFDRDTRDDTTDHYRVPIDIATNLMDVGGTNRTTAAQKAADITNPTSLQIILADGTTNTLTAGFGAPALHCGEGSVLYVDDSVRNIDSTGARITPFEGRVPANLTLQNGTKLTEGDPLYRMDSTKPGKLVCNGGSGGTGIGSGAHEDSGLMVFDGGVIETTAYGNTSYPGAAGTPADVATELYCGGTGTGIGGGFGGGGTNTIFNGGVITAVGSYHGAGIGAGCLSTASSWGPGSEAGAYYDYAHATRDQLPNTLPSRHGLYATGADPDNLNAGSPGQPNAGNITVNGGNVTSQGFVHGYAFGNACGSRGNNGGTLLITGGNLTPVNNEAPAKLLGAVGMAITVQGGSFYAPSSGFTGTVTDGRGKTLTMVQIDMAGYDGLKGAQLKSLTVTVNGAPLTQADGSPYEYGLPYGVDDKNKVYFWLPNSVTGQTVAIGNFVVSNLNPDGTRTETPSDYDFVLPNVGTGDSLAKRYVEVNVDQYVAKTPGLHDVLFKRYDGRPIGVDDTLKATVAGFKVPAGEPADKTIDDPDKMTIGYRRTLDGAGNPTTDEFQNGGGYVDAGSYEVVLESDQWSSDTNFSKSFWGHKLFLSSAIIPADSEVSVVTHTLDYDSVMGRAAGARANGLSAVNLAAKVMPRTQPQGDLGPEATTCAAPDGKLQFYANGVAVGEPVTLTAGGTTNGYAYSNAVLKWTDFKNYQIPRNAKGTVEIQGVYQGAANFNASKGLSTEIEPDEAKDFPFIDTPEITVKPQNPDPDAPPVPELKPTGPATSGDPDPEATNKDIKNTLHNTVNDTYSMPVQPDGAPLSPSDLKDWAEKRYGIPAGCEFGDVTVKQGDADRSDVPTNTPGSYQVSIPVRDKTTGNTTTIVVDLSLTDPPAPIKPAQPDGTPGKPLPIDKVTEEPNRGTVHGEASDTVSRPVRDTDDTPETIKDWIEDYYELPEGATVSKPVLKDADGNPIDRIDGSKPGSYVVEFEVTDPKGNSTKVTVDYNLRPEPELKPSDPDKSDLKDKGSTVDDQDLIHKEYDDNKPVTVPPTAKPVGKDDILKEAEDRYDVPDDWKGEVTIKGPDGSIVDAIDPSVPGTYEVTVVYTTPDGDTVTVHMKYVVEPGAGKKNDSDRSKRLAQTGDEAIVGTVGLIGALGAGLATATAWLRRRRD